MVLTLSRQFVTLTGTGKAVRVFFFDTECTQDLERHDGSFVHVPNLICVQQMCSKCEVVVGDINVDCEQCGKRTHVFWQDPVGKFIDFLRQSRPFAD